MAVTKPIPRVGMPANVRIVVHAEPIPKARPRFVRATGRAFTPRTTELAEHRIRQAWLAYLPAHLDGYVPAANGPLPGPLALDVIVFLRRPAGHFGSGRNAGVVKDSAPGRPCGARRDWDNYGKAASDGLTGAAWRDDGQIVDARVRKFYADDEPPRWEITVRQIVGDGCTPPEASGR
jgi:Holliday junction resolvase RusA-like endonuclease